MVGTSPVSGDLSMDDLAATLTVEEQSQFEQLTALVIDPNAARNLATFITHADLLGELNIVASGAPSAGTKILSPTAYIEGKQTKIDVYRL